MLQSCVINQQLETIQYGHGPSMDETHHHGTLGPIIQTLPKEHTALWFGSGSVVFGVANRRQTDEKCTNYSIHQDHILDYINGYRGLWNLSSFYVVSELKLENR